MIMGFRFILILCGIVLFPMLLLMGCAEEHLPEQSGFVLPQKHMTSLTREEQHGKVLYEYYCVLCHGMTGEGDGFNSFSLSTPPARHADATFMGTLSDTQIQLVIREGGSALGRSPQMPPWGRVLTDQEISDMTAFIRTLAQPDEGKKQQ
jgi:mono/diheme cytochrome c family protein